MNSMQQYAAGPLGLTAWFGWHLGSTILAGRHICIRGCMAAADPVASKLRCAHGRGVVGHRRSHALQPST